MITKSVSRFARNSVDTLNTIRQLEQKKIAVVFEKEGINTLDSTGEMLVMILGSLAQEESRNISENVRWGIARKFEEGKVWVNYKFFLGYTKNEDGELVIVPEEAEVVRLIFRLYLEGASAFQIKRHLEEKGILTVKGCKNWSESTIMRILGNEKYMGDALLQKTYTVDYLTKTRLKNDGAVKQYYIRDSHEGIIPKDLFYRVQEERMRRTKRARVPSVRKAKGQTKGYSSKYILGNLLVCGECGHCYRRITWSRDGEKRIVWRCGSRVKDGTKYCRNSATLDEKGLQRAVMRVISRIARESPELQDSLRQNIAAVLESRTDENESRIAEYIRKQLEEDKLGEQLTLQ